MKINEIFYSLQGESTQMGRPCAFIRLTGCKLRCGYCDTKYAYYQGKEMSIAEIMEQVQSYPTKLVQVTGGEPLEQKECPGLMERLIEHGYEVMLETNGVEDISVVPSEVRIVMDIKTPGSGEANSKTIENISKLRPNDEVKFVLVDQNDYTFAKNFIVDHNLERFIIHLSPVSPEKGNLEWLPKLILKDGLPVRFQPQMHKLIWGDQPGV